TKTEQGSGTATSDKDSQPQAQRHPAATDPSSSSAEAYVGEKQYHEEHIKRRKVYDALTRLAPSTYKHAFKVMMVGQSWIEQGGLSINNNFMGFELANAAHPKKNEAYVKLWTSDIVSPKEITEHPDKHRNWKETYKNRQSIE